MASAAVDPQPVRILHGPFLIPSLPMCFEKLTPPSPLVAERRDSGGQPALGELHL